MAKSKTSKKSSAIDTPAKTEVKTPKQAENTPEKTKVKTPKQAKSTPAKAAPQTPKMKKEVPVEDSNSTPKAALETDPLRSVLKSVNFKPQQKRNTRSYQQTVSETIVTNKKSKKNKHVEDDEEMVSDGEEMEVQSKSEPSKNPTKKVNRFCVNVENLPLETKKGTVWEYFLQFGRNKTIVPRNEKNKAVNKGFAFVHFYSQKSVVKAMAQSKHVIDGSMVDLKEDQKSCEEYSPQPSSNPNELFVSNINIRTIKKTIEEYFSKYGKVTNINLSRATNTRLNKGFGYVSFESAHSIQSVLSEDHKIDGHQLSVQRPQSNQSENGAVPEKMQ